jgi:hypothetical protein
VFALVIHIIIRLYTVVTTISVPFLSARWNAAFAEISPEVLPG